MIIGRSAEDAGADLFFIVPAEKARAFEVPKTDTYWTPSTADVRAAAEAIKAYLPKMREPRGQEMILAEWAKYRAQFVGVVRNGKRQVAANFFCSVGLDDRTSLIWQHHWVVASDGGPCYFHFEFDPKDGSIHDLVINGLA